MIDLVLLGTGGNMPMPNRYLSALCISYRGRKILIDCGEGTQVSMRIANTGFKNIDVICITHIHGDHIIGLPGLLSTIGNSGRETPLNIIGPEGITKAIEGLMTIVPYLPYEVNIIENPQEDVVIDNEYIKGDIVISSLEVDHSSPCMAYSFYFKRKAKFDIEKAIYNNVPKLLWNKLQQGESITVDNITYTSDMVMGQGRKGIKLSFVTDTRPTNNLVEFIRDSSLFICEGMYGDENDLTKAITNKHMTFLESATLAKVGNVKELILTHFSPAMITPEIYEENAKNIFRNTIIGYDRLIRNLKFED